MARTLDAGAPAGWAAGDEGYGSDPGLRSDLEDRQVGYVLAIATFVALGGLRRGVQEEPEAAGTRLRDSVIGE